MVRAAGKLEQGEAQPMRNNFTGGEGHKKGEAVRKLDSILEVGRMNFRKVPEKENNMYMGKTQRSAITGEIFLASRENWPNFDLVDLFSRANLHGNLRQYLEDKYVFLPVPMPYRSWIYHEHFVEKKVSSKGNPEFAMVAAVLATRCIDVDVTAGRWSPIMAYSPMVLILCITGDMLAVCLGILLVLYLWLISANMNTTGLYNYVRIASFVPRISFAGLLIFRLLAAPTFAQVAIIVVLLGVAYDFLNGDLAQLRCYRMNCSYEIVQALPERVFVCRRIGGGHLEQRFGWRGLVDHSLHGLGKWPKDFYLIADIHGMLAELRPVRVEDMIGLHDEQCESPRNFFYVPMKTFSWEFPNFESLHTSTQAQLRDVCKRFEESVPKDSLLSGQAPDRCMGSMIGGTLSDWWSQPKQPKAEVQKVPTGKAPAMVVETDL